MEGVIKVMTPKDGDRHIAWDSSDEKGLKKAKKEFDKLLKKGYRMYKVARNPQRTGEPVTEFDPTVSEYIAAPAMAGG